MQGQNLPEDASKLKPLADVGLGYVRLGQSSSTLSGGESQRVKLAFYLSQEKSTERMLFIFDEPTTGLHFHDISKLMKSLNAWLITVTLSSSLNITWR
jgi:excinuclease ABC subunit A